MIFRTRFAPSPTGPLHLGHAYSAVLAHDIAVAAGGEFLLRIEDIDTARARPAWETQIYEDLTWLGLHWENPVMRQSTRLSAYQSALISLYDANLIYPCTCSRRDIAEAANAPQEGAPLIGPDGMVYPGTCAHRWRENNEVPFDPKVPYRLSLDAAFRAVDNTHDEGPVLHFDEQGSGPEGQSGRITISQSAAQHQIGDPVLSRRDMGTSYHLSVVLDDAAQGITHVVRGEDLFEATKIHVILQKVLGLPTPQYHHHALIRDSTGKRLAKRDDARAISLYRSEGQTPQDIRAMIGL